VPFTYGTIRVQGLSYDEDHVAIIQELAEAISLGYIRILDFPKVGQAQQQLIDELEEELQTAHTLQMGLMPTEPPQIDGYDIAGCCIPANHVGGDFFQYFQQDGKLSVCMADVTGHAMAAVPVMMFSGVLNTEMGYGHSVEQLFSKLTNTLHQRWRWRKVTTSSSAQMESSRRLTLTRRCPALSRRRRRSIRLVLRVCHRLR
jgi:serine phosphatase RsbU (regulator of sigma subunit)